MATAKQIAANRLNALLSTGPKTIEGKAAARRNALKHGLTGAGIVMPIDEEELVQERTAELCSSLKPMHTYDLFLTEEIALEQLRAERCRRLERARRQRLAEDALEHWEEQRNVATEQLGAQLSNEPALCARLLQRTLQGCDWLLERWHGLGRALERLGDWSDDQRRLALDLLGTPPELRRGGTPLDESSVVSGQLPVTSDPSSASDPTATETARLGVVADEIERLTRFRDEVLEPRDEAEQRAAFYGEGAETDPELQLLHRYEAACQRRKAWALKQLNKSSAPAQGRGREAGARRVPPSSLAADDPTGYDPLPLGEGGRRPGEGGSGAGPAPGSFSLTRPLRDHPLPRGEGRIQDGQPLAEEGAISPDLTTGYLEMNESACAPFLPAISGGAPTAHEPQSAPPLRTLGGLRACFTPPTNRGNRHARRASRARGLS